ALLSHGILLAARSYDISVGSTTPPAGSVRQLGLQTLNGRAGAAESREQGVRQRRGDLRRVTLLAVPDRVAETPQRLVRGLQHAAFPLHRGAGGRLGRAQLGAHGARLCPDDLRQRR